MVKFNVTDYELSNEFHDLAQDNGNLKNSLQNDKVKSKKIDNGKNFGTSPVNVCEKGNINANDYTSALGDLNNIERKKFVSDDEPTTKQLEAELNRETFKAICKGG